MFERKRAREAREAARELQRNEQDKHHVYSIVTSILVRQPTISFAEIQLQFRGRPLKFVNSLQGILDLLVTENILQCTNGVYSLTESGKAQVKDEFEQLIQRERRD